MTKPKSSDPSDHDKTFAAAEAEARARDEAARAAFGAAADPGVFRSLAAGVGAFQDGLAEEGVPAGWLPPIVDVFRDHGLDTGLHFAPETARHAGRLIGAYAVGLGLGEAESVETALRYLRTVLDQAHRQARAEAGSARGPKDEEGQG